MQASVSIFPPNKVWGKVERGGRKYTYILHITYIIYIFIFRGGGVNKKKNSSRKTLKSPQSRPYEDLYKGRGKPDCEPEWVKDNFFPFRYLFLDKKKACKKQKKPNYSGKTGSLWKGELAPLWKTSKISQFFHLKNCSLVQSSYKGWTKNPNIFGASFAKRFSTSKEYLSLLYTSRRIVKNSNKNLRSVIPYLNLFLGRGIPNPEPFWVKSNGYPLSMFGASWSTKDGPTTALPIPDPKIYHKIKDPYHNRKKILEVCRGMRVVYIWTYKPKAFCLVGSSSNSVERVLSYFRAKTLLLEKRRATKFFSYYGFKNVDLYIIPLPPKKYSLKDMKLLESYYIKELYTLLNIQRKVYISNLTTEKKNLGNSSLVILKESAVPLYVFNKDNPKKVLYVFSSLTKFKKEFQINLKTLKPYLNIPGKFYLDLFYFTTYLPMEHDFNNLVSLEELLKLKESRSAKKYHGKKSIELIDLQGKEKDTKLYFSSMQSLIKHIKLNSSKGVFYGTINKYAELGTVFRDRWIIKFSQAEYSSSSVEKNLDVYKENNNLTSTSVSTKIEDVALPSVDKEKKRERSSVGVAISVEITNIIKNEKSIFSSLKEAAKFIQKETGKGTDEGLKYALDKGTAYLNIYLARVVSQSIRLTDLKTKESIDFLSLREAADWIKEKMGKSSYAGLHWSYKNGRPYLKRFEVIKVNN